jgi:hypothetical protein
MVIVIEHAAATLGDPRLHFGAFSNLARATLEYCELEDGVAYGLSSHALHSCGDDASIHVRSGRGGPALEARKAIIPASIICPE